MSATGAVYATSGHRRVAPEDDPAAVPRNRPNVPARNAGDVFLGGSSESAFADPGDETILTNALVDQRCREFNGYRTASINTTLHLEGLNVRRVQSLERYSGLRALFLENNLLTRLEGLGHLADLRMLYAHHNLLQEISGLEGCTKLDTLNVSHNRLSSVANLPLSVTTLHAAGNHIRTVAGLRGLQAAPCITVVDLSRNNIGGECLGAFTHMPSLRVLYLMKNPITSVKWYRRSIVAGLTGLTFLDELPVNDDERCACEAWAREPLHQRSNEAYFRAKRAFHDTRKAMERASYRAFSRARADRAALRALQALTGAAPPSPGEPGGTVQFDPAPNLPTASREAIDVLGRHVVTQEEVDQAWSMRKECIICQEAFCAGNEVLNLPCSHRYHERCIKPWLLTFSDTCPMCRLPITAALTPRHPRTPAPPREARTAAPAGAAHDATAGAGGGADPALEPSPPLRTRGRSSRSWDATPTAGAPRPRFGRPLPLPLYPHPYAFFSDDDDDDGDDEAEGGAPHEAAASDAGPSEGSLREAEVEAAPAAAAPPRAGTAASNMALVGAAYLKSKKWGRGGAERPVVGKFIAPHLQPPPADPTCEADDPPDAQSHPGQDASEGPEEPGAGLEAEEGGSISPGQVGGLVPSPPAGAPGGAAPRRPRKVFGAALARVQAAAAAEECAAPGLSAPPEEAAVELPPRIFEPFRTSGQRRPFVACARFVGKRAGYVFKLGDQGVGYYLGVPPSVDMDLAASDGRQAAESPEPAVGGKSREGDEGSGMDRVEEGEGEAEECPAAEQGAGRVDTARRMHEQSLQVEDLEEGEEEGSEAEAAEEDAKLEEAEGNSSGDDQEQCRDEEERSLQMNGKHRAGEAWASHTLGQGGEADQEEEGQGGLERDLPVGVLLARQMMRAGMIAEDELERCDWRTLCLMLQEKAPETQAGGPSPSGATPAPAPPLDGTTAQETGRLGGRGEGPVTPREETDEEEKEERGEEEEKRGARDGREETDAQNVPADAEKQANERDALGVTASEADCLSSGLNINLSTRNTAQYEDSDEEIDDLYGWGNLEVAVIPNTTR